MTRKNFKVVHPHGDHTSWLDHRLTPEVRAMLTAMASRLPAGGVEQRARELVQAAMADHFDDDVLWNQLIPCYGGAFPAHVVAAEQLTEYPLLRKVKAFFDTHVARYGHGSVLELAGGPHVFIEDCSWLAAWLLFDSPLVAGQEASTRALDFTERGMCAEAHGDPELADLHKEWLAVFAAEVAAWKVRLADPAERARLGIGDQEPFRPAFDRARWALPGTIATACGFASPVRERARAIRDARAFAQWAHHDSAVRLFDEVADCYRAAAPGIGALGLREAVYAEDAELPMHLRVPMCDDGVDVAVVVDRDVLHREPAPRKRPGTYLDPAWNDWGRVGVTIRCSLAVARDWHRHRTFYPMGLAVVVNGDPLRSVCVAPPKIDHHYKPISEYGAKVLPAVLWKTQAVVQDRWTVDRYAALLALPLGTRVQVTGWAGLRDAVYAFELRANAIGGHYEYREQAQTALAAIRAKVPNVFKYDGGAE